MGGQAAGEMGRPADRRGPSVKMVLRGLRAKSSSPDINHSPACSSPRIQAATYMVFGMAELDREKAGMGTTISAMLVSPARHRARPSRRQPHL